MAYVPNQRFSVASFNGSIWVYLEFFDCERKAVQRCEEFRKRQDGKSYFVRRLGNKPKAFK